MPNSTLLHASVAVLLGLTAVACGGRSCGSGSGSGSPRGEVVCPAILIQPHAQLLLDKPMSEVGTYDVAVEVDGQSETCSVTITAIRPAQSNGDVVESPRTDLSSTCKLVQIKGIGNAGDIGSFVTSGTPASIRLKVTHQGTELANGSAKPDYTPDECGFVKPAVKLTPDS